MKQNLNYYFTVEGETEQWYFEWLQDTVNADSRAAFNVSLKAEKQKDPLKKAKRINVPNSIDIYHVFDFESEDPLHTKRFIGALERMKDASKLGKAIKYKSAYSNYTFDLWIILHKRSSCPSLSHRKDYLSYINSAFSESFESMNEYKEENNFKRVLSKLSLDDVVDAIDRAKAIDSQNHANGCRFKKNFGYEYCCDNPATDLWIPIERILREAKIL